MRKSLVFAVAVSLLILGACRDESRPGKLFDISGKLFVFNYRVATATYLVTLKPLGPIEEGQTAVASFEDPAGGEAIVVRQKIWPNLDKTVLESPPLRCVRKDRPYSVTIRIEGPDGAVRQEITTAITSNLDQEVLPDRPLVVGPVYTPNPDLAGRPDGKLDVTNEAGCPGRA
ncbi:MAG: hypothetical protein M9939_14820 [Mesorhizobium sp.]|nr:hypothetical protein [Mesorhizobium sp.]MCO5162403.1 hypothetical protein [Mesorhizobium sp.]